MTLPLGVILAGGRATRMGGGDKGRLMLQGQTLFEHVLERLRPQVAGLALNANGDGARFADLGRAVQVGSSGFPVLPDSLAGHPGPLAGVLAGLDWAAEQGAETIVTAAADTPFFPRDLVAGLMRAAQGMEHPLALAASEDPVKGVMRHPTFGLWPVALRDDLRDALREGLRKVVLWTDAHCAAVAEFPVAGHDPFFNVNTPADLKVARGFAAEAD